LAGLAAAVRLTQSHRAITVHEATAYAGGRCRSYHDSATDMLIDNGTHLLLSGNYAALSFVNDVGSSAGLHGPEEAEFPFIDLANGKQWTLRFGESRFPWWVFDKDRRVPQTSLGDYLPIARLAWAKADKPIADVLNCSGTLYTHFLEPLLLAALNIAPPEGSAKLAGVLIRETIALGGQACRPPWRATAGAVVSRFHGCAAHVSVTSKMSSLRCSFPKAAHRNFNSPSTAWISAPMTPLSLQSRLTSRPSWCPASRCRPHSAASSTRISASIRRPNFRPSSV
jgi:hypothetical protein